MRKRLTLLITLLVTNIYLFAQLRTSNEMINQKIIDNLIKPVQEELQITTILSDNTDSYWNTKDYWEEKELDAVRAIIFYCISDTSKVFESIQLILREQPELFHMNSEVSSLLVKLAYINPNKTLQLLQEFEQQFNPESELFDPYGDVIYASLFRNLKSVSTNSIELNLVAILNKRGFGSSNWPPMFQELIKNGSLENIRTVLEYNKSMLKPIDFHGYYSTVLQAKGMVYGMDIYDEILNIIDGNNENQNRVRFGLLAINKILENQPLSKDELQKIETDLAARSNNLIEQKTLVDQIEKSIQQHL